MRLFTKVINTHFGDKSELLSVDFVAHIDLRLASHAYVVVALEMDNPTPAAHNHWFQTHAELGRPNAGLLKRCRGPQISF
jgi:hypothetical protein